MYFSLIFDLTWCLMLWTHCKVAFWLQHMQIDRHSNLVCMQWFCSSATHWGCLHKFCHLQTWISWTALVVWQYLPTQLSIHCSAISIFVLFLQSGETPTAVPLSNRRERIEDNYYFPRKIPNQNHSKKGWNQKDSSKKDKQVILGPIVLHIFLQFMGGKVQF